MPIPKMRVFAGPNGSGKTTILSDLRDRFQFGVYVNADDIELGLGKRRQLDFGEYRVSVTSAQVQQFFKLEAFSPGKTGVYDLWK